jgi:hypothetical protein
VPDGFQVDPDELTRAGQEILGYVDPTRETDLTSVPGDQASYGHPAVIEALARYCVTWQLATDLLVKRSDGAGRGLAAEARSHVQIDQSVAARLETGIH